MVKQSLYAMKTYGRAETKFHAIYGGEKSALLVKNVPKMRPRINYRLRQ
jgi:hypothetical protein